MGESSMKKLRLNHEVEAFLTSHQQKITYGDLGNRFKTTGRAIGQCMQAINKRNPKLTALVIFKKNK